MHEHYDYLIIGGGIAGVTAAETIREHDHNARIAIVEREPHVLYSRVLLPHYLKRHIGRPKLFLRTPEDFTNKKIDIHQEEAIKTIDSKHKDITLETGKTFQYEKLLLATGGRVKEWGRPEDKRIVYRLQTLDDADRLFEALPSIHNPLVVGSSFISLEFLEIFLANQIKPTLLVRDGHFFGNLLEQRGGALMNENFMRLGIQVDYDDTIAHIASTPNGTEIMTQNSKKISVDAIVVGIGVDRNVEYARSAGITVGEHGIVTNEFLETSEPDIFAAGDVAEYYDIMAGTSRCIGNWTNAVLQGKRAGLNMAGKREAFKSVPSYSITNLGFQITALGDTVNHDSAIVRMNDEHKQYERFFFKGNTLAGAVLINRFRDKTHLAKVIEHKIDIAPWRDRLADYSFDIHDIKVVG